MRKYLLNPKFVWMMALWMTLLSAPPQAMAYPSASLTQAPSVREAQIAQIMSVLSQPNAQAHLRLMGIDSRQLGDSLAKLDDSQLSEVAQRAETIKAGGDGLGLVVTLLVIAVLVLLIMKLNDKRIVVKDA